MIRALWAVVLLVSPARADDTSELLEWADAYETRRGLHRREPIPGDYVSNFGTLVEQSCLRGLSRAERERATEEFEDDLGGAIERLRACDESHPALRGFLKDALAVLRRSVVNCTAPADSPEGSMAYAHPIHSEQTPDSHGREVDEPARASGLYYISLSQANLKEHNRRYFTLQRSGAYFHESLHYTGANNRGDHDRRERIAYTEANACGDNALDDRIVLLQAACGFPGPASREQFADRVLRCGLRRGCMQTLTTVEPDAVAQWFDPHMYGPPMAAGDARIFCRRFQGAAAVERYDQGRLRDAFARAAAVERLIGTSLNGLLLSDQPTPAPRYLAALSPEERRRVAADRNFTLLAKLCVDSEDGSIRAADQPPACPLSSVRADPVGARLVELNNREAAFTRDLRELSRRLLAFAKIAPDELDRLTADIDILFISYCPARPDGEFVPRLCDEARLPLREAVASARRALDR